VCGQPWKDLLTSFEARIYTLMLLCIYQGGSKPSFLFLLFLSCPVLNRIKLNIWTLCALSNRIKSRRGTTDSQCKFLFCFRAVDCKLLSFTLLLSAFPEKNFSAPPPTLPKYIYCHFPVYYWSLLILQTCWKSKLENTSVAKKSYLLSDLRYPYP